MMVPGNGEVGGIDGWVGAGVRVGVGNKHPILQRSRHYQ